MLKDAHDRQVAREMAEDERGSEMMMLEGEGGKAGGGGWAPGAAVSRGGDGMEVGEEGGDGACGDLAELVGQLLAVGEDGCFRMVVGFL